MRKKIIILSLSFLLSLFSLSITSVVNVFADNKDGAYIDSEYVQSFNDLCYLSEEEYAYFCECNSLPYVSPEIAINELSNGSRISVRMRLDNYIKDEKHDVIVANDTSNFDVFNTNNYFFEKMVSDLNFPEELYDLGTEYDYKLLICFDYKSDNENTNNKPSFIKVASINVMIKDVDESISKVRLYQLISSWSALNDNVYDYDVVYLAGAQVTSVVVSSPDTTKTTVAETMNTNPISLESNESIVNETEGTIIYNNVSTVTMQPLTTSTNNKTAENTITKESSPKTGDSKHHVMIALLLASFLTSATVYGIYVKKKQNN